MFWNKTSEIVLLKELKLNQDENCKVKLTGERSGILMWILSKIGMADISYSLSMTDDRVEIQAGKTVTVLPVKNLHNFNGGYKNNIWFLIGAISTILFGGFQTLISFYSSVLWGFSISYFISYFLPPLFFTIIVSGVFFWLYMNYSILYIELNAFNGLSYSLAIKSGSTTIQGGDTVTFDSIQNMIDTTIELTSKNSKYYSINIILH